MMFWKRNRKLPPIVPVAILLGSIRQVIVATQINVGNGLAFWHEPVNIGKCGEDLAQPLAAAINAAIRNSDFVESADVDKRLSDFASAIGEKSMDDIECSYKLVIIGKHEDHYEVSFQQPARKRGHGFLADGPSLMFPGIVIEDQTISVFLEYLCSPPTHHHHTKKDSHV